MKEKGWNDKTATAKLLKRDCDKDGRLVNPLKWGLQEDEEGGGDSAEGGGEPKRTPSNTKAGKNKGTVAEEIEFWKKVEAANWKVPTNGRDGPAASRFQRALDDDAKLNAEYKAIVGSQVQTRKSEFRS
eukprot:7722517-Pyramimonas_sp.AAC.1